jgi:hypothetical protein
MAFFSVQRNGYLTVSNMMLSVINDMIDHGFTVKYPSSFDPSAPLEAPFKIVLEAGPLVDPLAATQPWRVAFSIDDAAGQAVGAWVGSPFQIKDDGTISTLYGGPGGTAGLAGTVGKMTFAVSSDPDTGLFNRTARVSSLQQGTYPLNYRLTVSSRGFFLGAFEGNWASNIYATSASYFNWILVQRPVDKTSGTILTTGKCPVFCVNKVNDKYWRFVVRESDLPHPTAPVPANSHSEDNFRIINTQNQISITEEQTYLVSFMNNLNTPRFRYTEELDMIGLVSSDVIMEGIEVPVTVYGGSKVYTALPGSSQFNTGVRILALTSE